MQEKGLESLREAPPLPEIGEPGRVPAATWVKAERRKAPLSATSCHSESTFQRDWRKALNCCSSPPSSSGGGSSSHDPR